MTLPSARKASLALFFGFLAGLCALCGCPSLALETELAITNVSRDWYLLLELEVPGRAARQLPIFPPGACLRIAFRELFDSPCPLEMTVRAYLYERDDSSDGADDVLLRQPAVASAEATVHPCTGTAEDYPVYNVTLRDSPRGRGTILFAQNTSRELRLDFWRRNIPDVSELPPFIADELISGYVLDWSGDGVSGIGVMLQPMYRDAGDPCPSDSGATVQLLPCGILTPMAEVGAPIDATMTDEQGRFTFSAPPGVYAVEVFADGYLFRPSRIIIEAPMDNVVFLAEPDMGG